MGEDGYGGFLSEGNNIELFNSINGDVQELMWEGNFDKAKSIYGKSEPLLSKEQTPPALRDVESTAKALEGIEKTNKTENTNTDIGYHGTPYNYDSFDASKIGTGEGASKRGKGIYFMRSKRLAPYFANINSEDAPIHIGKGKSKADKNKIDPRIFEVSGLDNLKLKKGSPRDVSNWASRQQEFVGQGFDGFETTSGEITVFPESIKKVKIDSKNTIGEFIGKNADIEFREWTTEQGKENKVVSESYHKAKADGSNPELVNYKYQIQGLEEGETYLGNKNELSLPSLSPGEYTLTVSARIGEGDWCKNPAIIQINVESPFWWKWWFFGLKNMPCLYFNLGNFKALWHRQ
jgi:hypothetical protein